MLPSTHITKTTDSRIPHTKWGPLILLLPTDAHPDLRELHPLGQWTTEPLHSGARSVDRMTGVIPYDETVSARTATDFGGEVYINTISGLRTTGFLEEADKEVLRKLYDRSREIYRDSEKSVDSKSPEWEWDAEHGTAFSRAFVSAMKEMDPHRQCKAGGPCRTGKRTWPGTSCQPTEPALRDLPIIPQVLTAKSLGVFRECPLFNPGYDFHTIKPNQRASSSTMPETQGMNIDCGSGEMILPPGMVVFGTGAL